MTEGEYVDKTFIQVGGEGGHGSRALVSTFLPPEISAVPLTPYNKLIAMKPILPTGTTQMHRLHFRVLLYCASAELCGPQG